MVGQSAVFKKSRRAGKSASFHNILKYGGAIRFLTKIKEDREIHILSPYFNYGRVIRIKKQAKSKILLLWKSQGWQGNPFFPHFVHNMCRVFTHCNVSIQMRAHNAPNNGRIIRIWSQNISDGRVICILSKKYHWWQGNLQHLFLEHTSAQSLQGDLQ